MPIVVKMFISTLKVGYFFKISEMFKIKKLITVKR